MQYQVQPTNVVVCWKTDICGGFSGTGTSGPTAKAGEVLSYTG